MRYRLLVCLALLGAALAGCVPRMLPGARIHETPPYPPGSLGVHLESGDLIVLQEWAVEGDPPEQLLGSGTHYDARRNVLADAGDFTIPYDSIVLLESTVVEPGEPLIGESFGGAALAVYTGLTGLITLACLADPKSCFGSCPTVYADPDAERPVAEAFSGSVARALEARDIDALPTVRPRAGRVELTLRNEAMETHALRSLRLLAVAPGPAGVAAADDGFYRIEELRPPTRCTASEGDCLGSVRAGDGVERRSWADSTDLAAREVIELEFPATDGPTGLVLSARHTFVSTYVFYQMLAYLGRDGAAVLAAVERGERPYRAAFERAVGMLGDMAIEIERDGRWEHVGTFREPGPLATDRRLVPLPAADGPVRVRLTLVRGFWRLDAVALAGLGPVVEPTAIPVTAVEHDGRPDTLALARIRGPDRYLVTYPGDRYDLTFDVPREHAASEFFLDATGYYYEWMRREWLAERDPAMVALFMLRPGAVFRRLAPAFKEVEPRMEELFWASRFGRDR